MREHNGVHTCDRRRARSDIHAAFPEYAFEEGFTERDELWKPDYRETHDDIDRRAKNVLDKIFDRDAERCRRSPSSFFSPLSVRLPRCWSSLVALSVISITAHGGFIGGFLRMCKHRPWILPTGGLYPTLANRSGG